MTSETAPLLSEKVPLLSETAPLLSLGRKDFRELVGQGKKRSTPGAEASGVVPGEKLYEREGSPRPFRLVHGLDVEADPPLRHVLGVGRSLINGLVVSDPGSRVSSEFPAVMV